MDLERSASIINGPLRLVMETEAEAHQESGANGSSSSSWLGSTSRKKAKAIGGTSSINSSHYVDFCSDPTAGFPEFQSQSKSNARRAGSGGIDKMLSPWVTVPESVPVPAPPRATTLHPSVSPAPSSVACLQGPSCPHCVPQPPAPLAAPVRIVRTPGPSAFSSTSISLKPWQWPRRSKPVKPRQESQREPPEGTRLFFTAPYMYFGFGRGRGRGPDAGTSGGPTLPRTLRETSSSSSNPSTAGSGTGADSSSSFGSSCSSSHSHSSAPRSLPSCQVHAPPPIRIRTTATAPLPVPVTASPYYYLRKYGTTTSAYAEGDDDKSAPSSCSWSSACCKKIKYKSHGCKNSAAWSWWRWGNSSYGAAAGKRQAQALRTFQLICMMLCILGVATLLVITILSSIAKSMRTTTPFHDLHTGDDGVRLVDNVLVSNTAVDIEPEALPPQYGTSIRDQLQAWLFGNAATAAEEEHEALEPTNRLLNITNFKYVLNNEEMCHPQANSTRILDSPTPSKLYFMILVHSAPKHFQQRQAIRSTWGSVKSVKNLGIRLVFLLGQPQNERVNSSTIKFTRNNPAHLLQRSINDEYSLYGDIMQGNFPDTYHNLIYKHLMGYKWVLQFCDEQATTFILKTDDDVFIDIFQLIDFTLRNYGLQPTSSIVCNVYEGTFPIRPTKGVNSTWEPQSKWAVTKDEYPLSNYPKYCGGLAYLITPDIIGHLVQVHERIMVELEASNRILRFWIDDVYMTGVLRELADREPFYMNLRYAYDTKLYHPWMLNDEDGQQSSKPEANLFNEESHDQQEQRDRANRKALHKIPYMIVHLEQTNTLSEEMNRLWRKTMRVWQ